MEHDKSRYDDDISPALCRVRTPDVRDAGNVMCAPGHYLTCGA